jgi:hypothetical protein
MAIVIKNKLTGKIYNHSSVAEILTVQTRAKSSNDVKYEPLAAC